MHVDLQQIHHSGEWLALHNERILGIGLLLRYLPVKSYFGYLIVGFVAAVYLDIPILGVALIGFAIALIIYKNKSVEAVSPVVAGGMDEDE